jgi:hypothetical protein
VLVSPSEVVVDGPSRAKSTGVVVGVALSIGGDGVVDARGGD